MSSDHPTLTPNKKSVFVYKASMTNYPYYVERELQVFLKIKKTERMADGQLTLKQLN